MTMGALGATTATKTHQAATRMGWRGPLGDPTAEAASKREPKKTSKHKVAQSIQDRGGERINQSLMCLLGAIGFIYHVH